MQPWKLPPDLSLQTGRSASYTLPARTPKDRVQVLRRAFQSTLKDKDFLAEAVKSKLDVDPLTDEEVEKIVAGLFKLDAALVAKMAEILK